MTRYFVVSGDVREQVDDAQNEIEAAVIAFRRAARRGGNSIMLGTGTTVDRISFDHVGANTFICDTHALATKVGLKVSKDQ